MELNDTLLAGIADWVQERIDGYGTPGLTLAITDRESIVHEAAFGFADLAAEVPMRSDHLLETGSIGKSFTAICLLQLAGEGKVDFDTPITDYLPWFSIDSEFAPITLHHLLTHSAGITSGLDFAPDGPFQVWALKDSVATAAPGAHFHYSNIGYKIVGMALERIAGKPYGEIVRERILTPLGLLDAEPTIHHAMRNRLAVGYTPHYDDRPWWPGQPLTPATWLETNTADGCMAMTAAQLATYLRMLLNRGASPGGVVVPAGGFDRFAGRWMEVSGSADPRWYGYGINTTDVRGHTYIGHGGGMVGYFAGMIGDLDCGLGVTVLVNGPGEPNAIARQILDHLRSVAEGEPTPLPARTSPWDDIPVADFAGTYASEHGQVVTIEQTSGGVLAVRSGDHVAPLTPWNEDAFATDHPVFALNVLEFDRDRGEIVGFGHGGDCFVRAGRLALGSQSLPEDWSPYPGVYRSHCPWTPLVRVVARRGKLILIVPSEPDGLDYAQELVPLGDGWFRCGGEDWFPERIRFDSIGEGRALRANLSGADYYRSRQPETPR